MNAFLLSLITLTLVATQVLAGGERPAFCLPACVLLMLAASSAAFFRPRPLAAPQRLCLAGAAAFSAYILLRAATSPVPYLARADVFAALAGLVIYLVTALHLSQKDWSLIFKALLGLALVNVALEIVQRGNFPSFSFSLVTRSDPEHRSSGFFGNPNHLAGFLEIVLMMCLSVGLWTRRSPATRLLRALASCALFTGILLTGSRGGILATVAGLLTLAALSWFAMGPGAVRNVRKIVTFAVGAAVAMAAIVAGVKAWHPHLAARVAALHDVENPRWMLWSAALRQFRLSPLTGTGAGTHLFYARRLHDPAIQADPIHAHNDYLELLAEYGAAGLLICLCFVALHVWAGWRKVRSLAPSQVTPHGSEAATTGLAWQLGALGGIAACLTHSMFDFNMHLPANLLLMSWVWGVAAAGEGVSEMDSPRRVGLVLPPIALLLVFALPGMWGDLDGWQAERLAIRGDWGGAAASSRVGMKIDPGNAGLFFQMGMLEEQSAAAMPTESSVRARHLRDAIGMYRRSLELFPQNTRPLVRMAYTLDQMGSYAEADALYRTALEWEPDYSYLLAFYGFHYLTVGEWQTARQYYVRAGKLEPSPQMDEAIREIDEKLSPEPSGNAR